MMLAYGLGVAGFAALAGAMPRHWRQLYEGRPPSALLRAGGILLLAIAVVLICGDWNPARGIAIALGIGTAAAITVALLLTFAPRALFTISVAVAVAGCVARWAA